MGVFLERERILCARNLAEGLLVKQRVWAADDKGRASCRMGGRPSFPWCSGSCPAPGSRGAGCGLGNAQALHEPHLRVTLGAPE